MRGSDQQNGSLFSYVNLEERVPARHPLRKIKAVVDPALASLDARRRPSVDGTGTPAARGVGPDFVLDRRRLCRRIQKTQADLIKLRRQTERTT